MGPTWEELHGKDDEDVEADNPGAHHRDSGPHPHTTDVEVEVPRHGLAERDARLILVRHRPPTCRVYQSTYTEPYADLYIV